MPLLEPDFPVLRIRLIATVRHFTLRNDSEMKRESTGRSLLSEPCLSYVMKIGLGNAIVWYIFLRVTLSNFLFRKFQKLAVRARVLMAA